MAGESARRESSDDLRSYWAGARYGVVRNKRLVQFCGPGCPASYRRSGARLFRWWKRPTLQSFSEHRRQARRGLLPDVPQYGIILTPRGRGATEQELPPPILLGLRHFTDSKRRLPLPLVDACGLDKALNQSHVSAEHEMLTLAHYVQIHPAHVGRAEPPVHHLIRTFTLPGDSMPRPP
ncbi:hypothetical protein D9M72_220750 [compost metagenome]